MSTVSMLVSAKGETISIYAHQEQAEKVCARYNGDPWIEPGTPDLDAPYRVETMTVSDIVEGD